MKKTLFLIESPFQLLGALEAIAFYKIKFYTLVLRYHTPTTITQFNKLIDDKIIDKNNIKIITTYQVNSILRFMAISKFILWFHRIKKQYTYFYIGDYNSGLLKAIIHIYLKKEELFLLDDGVATINIQKKFSDTINYNLFTMYKLAAYKNQQVIQHHFTYLQKFVNAKSLREEQVVLILGHKFYEVGMIKYQYFFELLDKLLLEYKDYSIRYVAHRGEDIQKLQLLQQKYPIEIVQYDFPIELYGYYINYYPKYIVSFISTALLSMQKIYPRSSVIAYKFDLQQLLKHQDGFKEIYKNYSQYITVKEL